MVELQSVLNDWDRVACIEAVFLYNTSWERSVHDAAKRNASS